MCFCAGTDQQSITLGSGWQIGPSASHLILIGSLQLSGREAFLARSAFLELGAWSRHLPKRRMRRV